MTVFGTAFKKLTTAAIIALQIGAAQADDAVPQVSQPEALEQNDDMALIMPRYEAMSLIHEAAINIGWSMQALKISNDPAVIKNAGDQKYANTLLLQTALIDYTKTRPNHYFDAITVDGIFGPDTAAALIKVAGIENYKEIFLDIPGVQNAQTDVPYRFLRNQLKALAPAEFIIGLTNIASESERDNQTYRMQEFRDCVAYDGRRFAEELIVNEAGKIYDTPGYISPYVDDQCAAHLRGLPANDIQNLQIDFFVHAQIRPTPKPTEEREWCRVEKPDFIGHRCVELSI